MSDFLEFIQPTIGYTEIRSIKHGHVVQEYIADRARAQMYAEDQSSTGWDAYYGVLPRAKKDGKSAIRITSVLWADLDAKAHMGLKQLALTALTTYEIPPSVIVDSGHGYHAYWKLVAPIMWDEAAIVMKGLARHLHGDHVYDASRILRLPNTINYKDPTLPVPVRVIRFDTTRVMRISDFERARRAATRELDIERPPRQRIPASERGELPEWLDSLICDGAPQGTRSEASWKVVCELLERGYSDSEIKDVFETEGIGEKYREQRTGGDRWLERTIERAKTRSGN